MDTTRERNKDSKIPGVTVLNNFQYEDHGIRVWKAYDIGPGCFIPYSGLGVTSQADTGLRVIKLFGQATHRGSVGVSIRHQSKIYSCQETGCILTFKTQAEADNHMDMGKHPDVPSTSSQGEDIGSTVRGYDPRPVGWALKITKQPTRMTDNFRTLMKKFEEGARTGNKADPAQIAREMKTLRNEDRELTFKPEEWRTAQQISSLFSH